MDISIIIGLLIALVIVCATTIVNNLINKEYKTLKSRWDSRAIILSDIVWYAGNVDKYIEGLLEGKLDNDDRKNLLYVKEYINSMMYKVKSYEKEKF